MMPYLEEPCLVRRPPFALARDVGRFPSTTGVTHAEGPPRFMALCASARFHAPPRTPHAPRPASGELPARPRQPLFTRVSHFQRRYAPIAVTESMICARGPNSDDRQRRVTALRKESGRARVGTDWVWARSGRDGLGPDGSGLGRVRVGAHSGFGRIPGWGAFGVRTHPGADAPGWTGPHQAARWVIGRSEWDACSVSYWR
jgi:hypothetical protein